MMDAYFHTIPAKENVPDVLKAKGASLNVFTASPHITLDACLKRLGLWALFDNIWSCDDFNTTKADPQIYVMAANKLNRPVEEVLFLDDNLNADLTAKAAGMQICGVYDESSRDYANQMKAAADFYPIFLCQSISFCIFDDFYFIFLTYFVLFFCDYIPN